MCWNTCWQTQFPQHLQFLFGLPQILFLSQSRWQANLELLQTAVNSRSRVPNFWPNVPCLQRLAKGNRSKRAGCSLFKSQGLLQCCCERQRKTKDNLQMNASIYTIDLKRKAPISHSSLVSQAPGCPDCSRLVGALSPKYLQQTQVTQRHLWVWTVRAQSILARHCLSHLPHCKRVCQSGLWIEWTHIYNIYILCIFIPPNDFQPIPTHTHASKPVFV